MQHRPHFKNQLYLLGCVSIIHHRCALATSHLMVTIFTFLRSLKSCKNDTNIIHGNRNQKFLSNPPKKHRHTSRAQQVLRQTTVAKQSRQFCKYNIINIQMKTKISHSPLESHIIFRNTSILQIFQPPNLWLGRQWPKFILKLTQVYQDTCSQKSVFVFNSFPYFQLLISCGR